MTIALRNLNVIALALWALTFITQQTIGGLLASAAHTVLTGIVVFVLAGASFNYMIGPIRKLRHDTAVAITLGILSSIFVVPPVLIALSHLTSLTNTAFISIFYAVLLLIPLRFHVSDQLHLNVQSANLKLLTHPLVLAAAILILLHTWNITRYQFLPGLDTYSWVITYEANLAAALYDMTHGINRVQFSTLVAILSRLSGLSIFDLFKFVLPYTAVASVPPLWLLARHLKSRWSQLLVLLASLASPSIILDFETSRHQLVVILFLYSMAGLLYTAHRQHNAALLLVTLLYAGFGTMYHPIFLFFATILLVTALWVYRHKLRQHWILSALALVAAVPFGYMLELDHFMYDAAARLSLSVPNFITGNWNLTFPHQYAVGKFIMSWPGLAGAAKYYGYFAGPATLVIAALLATLVVAAPTIKRNLRQHISPFLAPVIFLGIFFFAIAEILTRFANIAYLPDRAWTFLGILAAGALFVVLAAAAKLPSGVSRTIKAILVFSFVVSAGGAIHINSLTRYTIPDYELKAADWIQTNLPADKTFFVSSSKNVLRYHAGANLEYMHHRVISTNDVSEIISRINTKSRLKNTGTYIYFARTHPLNPYTDRPYLSSFTGSRDATSFPAIEAAPAAFMPVYQDDDKVYIWQVNIEELMNMFEGAAHDRPSA